VIRCFSIRCITTGFGRTGTVDWQTGSIKTVHLQQLMVKVILQTLQVEHLHEFTSRFCWSNIVSVADYTKLFKQII
jgi:hypothetical protein